MDLVSLLRNCQNPDHNVRTQAEEALAQAGQQNMGELMRALVTELANEAQQDVIRQQAGMYVKLLLTAADEQIKAVKMQQWAQVPADAKSQIKSLTLQTLHSQSSQAAKHTAALIIGKMGAIELPQNAWPDMLPKLLENVTGQFDDGTKVASLETLGYMCDEWEPQEMDQQQTNQILTCIVDGIRADRPNPIRLAAAQALLNSLEFTQNNFETEVERTHIMTVVCEATTSPDTDVRRTAFECLASIAAGYYDKLQQYMQALFQLTIKAIQDGEEPVALQALEFWSTLCDQELEIKEEQLEAAEVGEPAERESGNYVTAALQHLVPLLLQCLTKQQEDGDEEGWGVAQAAATCLSLVALVAEDLVVDLIVPFVTANIQSENWHNREAAVMAFGAVLEGPSMERLAPLVSSAMPVLLTAMRDSNVQVKDTATWTIAKICELHVQSIPNELLPPLVQTLLAAMEEPSKVCAQACHALYTFGEAFEGQKDEPTNALSAYFAAVMEKLLQVMQREDWATDNMRVQAVEAMNVLIDNSAQDCKEAVVSTLRVVLSQLQASFTMQVLSTDDREKQQGLQSLLCGNLQVICRKLAKDVAPHADQMMMLLLEVFKSKHAICQEEAFMAAGSLADQLESGFAKYMDVFYPVLLQGLANHEEYQVCSVAVGCVGDLCRALEGSMAQYSDEIMRWLLNNLENAAINRQVKPPIIACLGDIAMAINGHFEKYLQPTMNMLAQAQGICVGGVANDDELADYLNQLRESILEAYSGIGQGLNEGQRVHQLMPYLPGIVAFLESLAGNNDKDDAVLRLALGLLGDLCQNLGAQAAQYVRPSTKLQALVQEGIHEQSGSTFQMAHWCRQQFQQMG